MFLTSFFTVFVIVSLLVFCLCLPFLFFDSKYRDIPYGSPIQVSTYCFQLPFLQFWSSFVSLVSVCRRPRPTSFLFFLSGVVRPALSFLCKYMLIELWYRLIVSDFFFYSVCYCLSSSASGFSLCCVVRPASYTVFSSTVSIEISHTSIPYRYQLIVSDFLF